jgi:hypothetical protein
MIVFNKHTFWFLCFITFVIISIRAQKQKEKGTEITSWVSMETTADQTSSHLAANAYAPENPPVLS